LLYWIRILIPNPDPEAPLNPEPDSKLCKKGYLTFFIKATRIREDLRDGPILVFQLVTVLGYRQVLLKDINFQKSDWVTR
jgi:hypothetical protein